MSYENWASLIGQTPSGIKVTLRCLHMDDLDRCGQWINSPEMRQVLQVDYPVGYQAEKEWLERITKPLPANPTDLPWAICANEVHVGMIGLHGISLRHNHAEIGLLIGNQSMRGKGVATTAYELVHQYAFAELNLRVLRADVYGHNQPSQRLHQRTGYEEVARLPEWYFKNGEYQDVLIYYLTREKWQTLRV